MSYYKNGIIIHRDAKPLDYLKKISLNDAKTGDLLYFEGHVALYLNKGKYIHANIESADVCVNSLYEGDSIYSEKYKNKFLYAATVFKKSKTAD